MCQHVWSWLLWVKAFTKIDHYWYATVMFTELQHGERTVHAIQKEPFYEGQFSDRRLLLEYLYFDPLYY